MLDASDLPKVLVLEDNSGIASDLSGMLSELGYDALVAGSTEEADGLISDVVIYAAILDNQVPRERNGPPRTPQGLYYGRKLKTSRSDVRVALHTDALEDYRELAQLWGLVPLDKPVDLERLASFLG